MPDVRTQMISEPTSPRGFVLGALAAGVVAILFAVFAGLYEEVRREPGRKHSALYEVEGAGDAAARRENTRRLDAFIAVAVISGAAAVALVLLARRANKRFSAHHGHPIDEVEMVVRGDNAQYGTRRPVAMMVSTGMQAGTETSTGMQASTETSSTAASESGALGNAPSSGVPVSSPLPGPGESSVASRFAQAVLGLQSVKK